MTKFRAGQTIEWESQSAGIRKTKRGKVLAVVHGGASLFNSLDLLGRKGIAQTRVKAQDRAANVRYLVEVPATGKATKHVKPPVYYAPLVAVIDGDSTSAGRAVTEAS